MGSSRAQAITRLEAIGRRSSVELADLVKSFRSSVDMAESKKRERLEVEQNAPEADRLSARLKEVSIEVGSLTAKRDEAERGIVAIEGNLHARRAELGRHVERIGRGAPALRKAAQADRVIELLDALLEEAVPTEVGAVAREMTIAWKSMAHFPERVDRIEITRECDVLMLNKKGENLHEIEKSAGASQVFTQALISAVTNASGRNFPFIVDTPLARLSKDQRLGVLKTFTQRRGQVIFLSTDEEVVDDKLDAIRDRVAIAYELKMNANDGVAVTSVTRLEI